MAGVPMLAAHGHAKPWPWHSNESVPTEAFAMHVVPFLLNIGTALLLGIAIGLERQYRHHPAGLRMNALVCLGAALFVSVGVMVNKDSPPDRIAAQVVSGIASWAAV